MTRNTARKLAAADIVNRLAADFVRNLPINSADAGAPAVARMLAAASAAAGARNARDAEEALRTYLAADAAYCEATKVPAGWD